MRIASLLVVVLSVAACGGGSSSPDGAGGDALHEDAGEGAPDAPSDALDGTFRLTTSATPDTYARRTFDHARGISSQAYWYPTNPTANEQASGFVGPFTFDGVELDSVRGGPATWDPEAGTLAVTNFQGTVEVWTRTPFPRQDAITVPGRIVFGTDAAGTLTNPHLAMIAIKLDEAGAISYGEAGGEVAGIDQPLTLAPDQAEATFTMTRNAAPLANELTHYGAATVAFEAFVLYQDKDGVPGLGTLSDDCTIAGTDCAYTNSVMYLAYRDGDSPELAASPYSGLTPGWALAAPASVEGAGIALTSLDTEGDPSVLLEVVYGSPTLGFRIER